MPRTSQAGLLALVVANLLLPLSVVWFASGFFPYKPFLPGHAQFDGHDEVLSPRFDKVIFMVVDALRSDFVYSNESSFLFVQDLIRKGHAIPFTAHAASPTITMPKVKAMTTGSVPSFLDVILNFAESDTTSTLAKQDTWPTQLRDRADGKQVVMYGDDTWLKLFPDTFGRSDGTSSFFVSDFTEVDNNVTRHIPDELNNDDWNAMVMHYLGLDHIGHKSGPRSPHMRPKQQEMDSVVKTIFEAMTGKEHLESTLLVLCGDHGMNDAGNHGGSAAGETSPALVFISPKFQSISNGTACPIGATDDLFSFYEVVEQSDIAPTLAGLLAFPIPLNNLGVFIPRLLSLWPEGNAQTNILYQNAKQMLRLVRATYNDILFLDEPSTRICDGSLGDGEYLSCLWTQSASMHQDGDVEVSSKRESILKFLKVAQQKLSSTASNYEIHKLQTGIVGAVAATAVATLALPGATLRASSPSPWFVLLVVGYGVMMFASSFVEEEHHWWYWTGSAWCAWLYVRSCSGKDGKRGQDAWIVLSLLATFRVLRRWNQTGQKLAGEPDIGRHFLVQNNGLLWILIGLTFVMVWLRLSSNGSSGSSILPKSFFFLVLCSVGLVFKACFTKADAPELLESISQELFQRLDTKSLVLQARVVFCGLLASLALMGVRVSRGRSKHHSIEVPENLLTLLTLFLITQTRAANIPVFLLFHIQHLLLHRLSLRNDEITLTSLILQFSSFFALGGSNAISSVDLSNAYNGVSGYNVVGVGILTFCGNWAGPIWWATEATVLLLRQSNSHSQALLRHLSLLTLWTSATLAFIMVACTALRTHLFVWTVFSPKYLYSMAWSIGQHLGVNFFLNSLVWMICVRVGCSPGASSGNAQIRYTS